MLFFDNVYSNYSNQLKDEIGGNVNETEEEKKHINKPAEKTMGFIFLVHCYIMLNNDTHRREWFWFWYLSFDVSLFFV